MNLKLRHTKIFRSKKLSLSLLLLFISSLFIAQNKFTKLSKEFNVTTTPLSLKMDAVHTDIVFKSWNKKQILVNSFIKGDLTTKQLQNQSKQWKLKVIDSIGVISIISDASQIIPEKNTITSYNVTTSNNQQQLTQIVQNALAPLIKNVQNNPLPKNLKQQLQNLHFDFDAYNNLGNTYLKIWEHNLSKNIDTKSVQAIQQWSNNNNTPGKFINVSQNNTEHTPNLPMSNVTYKMTYSKSVVANPNLKTTKTIEIYYPVNTNVKIRTRYGNVTVANELVNAKAELKYTSFIAQKISGPNTQIGISFSSVGINNWEAGNLGLRYVKEAVIQNANNINLALNSSKILIEKSFGNTNVESAFSLIKIENINTDFSQLNFTINSSDLILSLPQTAYNFAYNGTRSLIKIPENTLQLKSLENYNNQMLNGYFKSRNTDKIIQMNVSNSKVILF